MQLNKKFIYNSTFLSSLIFILCIVLQGVLNSSFLFDLAYAILLYNFLISKKRINMLIYFIAGMILDSNNNIILGLSSFIFLTIDLISSIEINKRKMDFIFSYLFFTVNILIIFVFVGLVKVFSGINFVSFLYFILINIAVYPALYLVGTIYQAFLVKQNEK